jgi:hypothetical protein
MEEKKSKKERTLVINIKLTRGLVAVLIAALLAVAFVGYLALGQKQASASPAVPEAPAAPAATSGGLRKYYRTATSYLPTEALTACATGYHFASLWEILDTSNLEYDTILGDYQDDSGYGPLTSRRGWVRTGYNSASTGYPGQNNCLAWMTNDGAYQGTSAELPDQWTSTDPNEIPDIGVWIVGNASCSTAIPVWCVED